MLLTVPHAPVRRAARSERAPTVAGTEVAGTEVAGTEVAGTGVARPGVARPDARTDRRTGVRANAATAEILCLGLSISLKTGQIHRLADTICDRVLGSARAVGTVILDLRADAGIDADSRAALLSLHRRLASMGTRLRIAAACRQLAAHLREDDLQRHLGADAIHDSVRSAVLATYASLPGPGLVTAQVRAALDTPVESVDS
jgi:MFS superfamily sulfate permease-like transporter